MTPLFPCDVECISSTKYGDRPIAVVLEDQQLPITDILKSWRSPQGIHFQVLTGDNMAYELSYTEVTNQWSCKKI
jgi:hypothetical protein